MQKSISLLLQMLQQAHHCDSNQGVDVCTSLSSDLGRGKSMCVLLRGAYKMGKNVARSGH